VKNEGPPRKTNGHFAKNNGLFLARTNGPHARSEAGVSTYLCRALSRPDNPSGSCDRRDGLPTHYSVVSQRYAVPVIVAVLVVPWPLPSCGGSLWT